MWLVPFALQLRAAFAALDSGCDAPAGLHRYQSPIAAALGQRSRRRASLPRWKWPAVTPAERLAGDTINSFLASC
jgi:hypothetical protein